MDNTNSFLVRNQHLVAALTLVGVLALCYKVFMLDAGKKFGLQSNEGFTTGAALSNMTSELSGLGQYGSNVSGAQNTVYFKNSEGMVPYEPPVFWNAGSYEDVNDHQQSTANDYWNESKAAKAAAVATEGMLNAKPFTGRGYVDGNSGKPSLNSQLAAAISGR